MASASFLTDIDVEFTLCPLCRENFQEPKLLPCLHRYCKNCLCGVLQNNSKQFQCCLCNHICDIPSNGVDGFKTDDHMKLILLFVSIQNAFANDEMKNCVECSYFLKVAAYCFRCNGFLCRKCYKLHLKDGIASEHYENILGRSSKDPENLTLEEMSFLTEVPECHLPHHSKQAVQQCCTTCSYLPVCKQCTQQEHRGHDLEDVTLVAKAERDRMNNKIEILRREMKYLENLKGRIENAMRKLDVNVTEKRRKIKSLYDKESSEIEIRLKENNDELRRSIGLIDEKEDEVLRDIHEEQNKEMLAIREKYQQIIDSVFTENESKRQQLRVMHLKRETNITTKEQVLEKDYQSLTDVIATAKNRNLKEIKDISEHSNSTLSRLQTLDSTVFSIFGMRDDWKDVIYLPAINVASDPLVKAVIKEFPQLEELSDFPIADLKPVYIDHGTIPQSPESVVDIEGINSRGWQINGMATVGDGNIVVTGRVSDEWSHITVINAKGRHQRQPEKRKKTRRSVYSPFRYCAPLTESKVATTCQCSSNFIALYDVRSWSLTRKDITDVITKEWSPIPWNVHCIATNTETKQILVGSFDRRDVHVFTDQLKHSHTLMLPDSVMWPRDMAVSQGNLIVCDDDGGKACLLTMPTPRAQGDVVTCDLICELPKPSPDSSGCRPICLCTDKSGFIYMLWDATIAGQLTSVLVQYSQSGRQLLTKRPVDGDARSLATMETRRGEKLLIATERTGKLYFFDLVKGNYD